jgi:diguanylate cyclase (GGDEF)-like protein
MKVLIVEDSPGYAALVRALLDEAAPAEFELVVTPRLADAVAVLLDRGAECVLLDLGLPDAEGLQALEQVRTAALDAPVVVLSGRDDEQVALRAVREGAQEYLVKGAIDGRLLARAIRHAVERKRIQAELAHQAMHDALTALPNRTLFFDRLRQALSRVRRTQTCLAVLFIDLDDFKTVNDTHGHAAGDALLIESGRRLQGVLRGGDTAARLGGDEFVVLCEDIAGREEARLIASRVLAELPSGASIGVALSSGGDVQEADELVRHADAAMYAVKRRGGGGFEVAAPGGRAPAQTGL